MYSVNIYTPVVPGAHQSEAIEEIVIKTLTDPKANIRYFHEPTFSVTVFDETGNERESQQKTVTRAIFADLFQKNIFSSERLRRAKIALHLKMLEFINEGTVMEGLADEDVKRFLEQMHITMDEIWLLCNKNWDKVRQELKRKDLEHFMEMHLGE